jgi:hypothetical protein
MVLNRDVCSPKVRPGNLTVIVLIFLAVVVTALLIIIPGSGSDISLFYSNWTINISAIVALGLSIPTSKMAYSIYHTLVNNKLRDNGYDHNDHALSNKSRAQFYTSLSFTIGLALWTSAELLWTYYQLGRGIENPFPSMADGIWLAGYPFIIYFTYGMNRVLSRDGFYDRESSMLLSVAAGLTLVYIFNLTFGVADIISASRDQLAWLISILYPLLDTVALVPAMLMIISINKNRRSASYSLHWLLLAASIVIVTVADIGFGYSEVTGTSDEEEWFWDIFYSASYIVMAGALYSYYVVMSNSRKEMIAAF